MPSKPTRKQSKRAGRQGRGGRLASKTISTGANRMSLGVLNNISAIYAENNLNQTSASLQNT
ncbi:MAG: hypothetical protein WA682_00115, partial [Acidobacteriaceae bacterium]